MNFRQIRPTAFRTHKIARNLVLFHVIYINMTDFILNPLSQ